MRTTWEHVWLFEVHYKSKGSIYLALVLGMLGQEVLKGEDLLLDTLKISPSIPEWADEPRIMHLNLVEFITSDDQFHAGITLLQGLDPFGNLRVPSTELQLAIRVVRHVAAKHVPLSVQGHNVNTHGEHPDVDEPILQLDTFRQGLSAEYTADGLSEMASVVRSLEADQVRTE